MSASLHHDQDEPCPECGGTGVTSEHITDDGMAMVTGCSRCHTPIAVQPWHVVSATDLLAMLRRCHAGEDPDMVYLEEYANAERPGDNDHE